MLEKKGRQGASILVYLLFCFLIAIFVVNFGPSGGRTEGGCTGDGNPILTVDGYQATEGDYHVAYSANTAQGKTKTYYALGMLTRREILAQAAEARGLRVSDGLVQNEIKAGHFYMAGRQYTIPHIFDENGFWNLNAFKSWVNQLSVTATAYEDEQRRDLLAQLEASLLSSSVQVSRDEALHQFLYENNEVTYEVMAFSPDDYHAAMRLTDADVQRYLSSHEDEVKARYKADERTYQDVKPELELREIFIAKAEPAAAKPADDKTKPADKGKAKPADKGKTKPADKGADKPQAAGADKAPEAPAGMPIDAAKAKLEAVRAAVTAGKQKFADAARELSTDPVERAAQGELGWAPTLDEKAVDQAAKKLKPGEMTPVITTDRGAYLVLAEAQRQGHLTYDQVKVEIARKLAIAAWPKEAARRAAIDALAKARDSHKSLEDVFGKAEPTPEPGGPREIKGQIAMMMQMAQDSHFDDEARQGMEQRAQMLEQVLQAWYTGMVDPKAKVEKPSADLMKPSADTLPAFDAVAPKVEKHGPIPRTMSLPGIGTPSATLAHVLFDELKPGDVADTIYEVGGTYYVIQLESHTTPDTKDFDKHAADDIAKMRQSRATLFVDNWVRQRCIALAKDKKIRPNGELITDRDDQGKAKPITYTLCGYL